MTHVIHQAHLRFRSQDGRQLGTISCRLYSSDKPFDDNGGKLEMYGINRSYAANSGVSTVSAFVASELEFFELHVSWGDKTADKTQKLWPRRPHGGSLCISMYCDGETKRPVVEYREFALMTFASQCV